MPKIRVRASKPNHPGSYNMGLRLEKNHTHQYYEINNTKNELLTKCKVPRCGYVEKKDGQV